MALLSVVSLVGLTVDTRVLTGLPIWAKPLKFAVSIAIYAVTLSWLLSQLRRWARLAWWAGTVTVAFLTVEVLIIVGAVIAGTTSHFNVATPLAAALWSAMATSIAIVWVVSMVVAALLFRVPSEDRARAVAIRAGAAIAVVGMGLAYLMTIPAENQLTDYQGIVGAHTVGLPDGGPGIPILGWSTVAGDLRIPHFVGMHALQVLPLTAAVLEAAARRRPVILRPDVRFGLMSAFSLFYLGLVAILTLQALSGESIVQPSWTTTAAFAALLGTASLAAVTLLHRSAKRSTPIRLRGARVRPHGDLHDNDEGPLPW